MSSVAYLAIYGTDNSLQHQYNSHISLLDRAQQKNPNPTHSVRLRFTQ